MSLQPILAILATSPLVQQLAPILVVLLIPLLVLTTHAHLPTLLSPLRMVFDFLWRRSSSTTSSRDAGSERRRIKKKPRTRAEQVAQVQSSGIAPPRPTGDHPYYPGIVNLSGTYCFMDSTLQALASLSYLQPYLDAVHAKAVALDVPSQIVDALRNTLLVLNTPRTSPTSLSPYEIVNALAISEPAKHRNMFATREHQDAQELFQLLSECIKQEASAVDREGRRDRGLGGLSLADQDMVRREVGRSVFDGLTANRRSCMTCGYTEAVMHFPFDSWQLALPGQTSACRLEDCIADYTRLEVLTDCVCRKCSLLETHRKLAVEAERLSRDVGDEAKASNSKKKRAREARKLEARVRLALEEGRIEEDIRGVKMEKVISAASTKQAMIARPPPDLALHLNRSIHYGYYAGRNNTRVVFPEILDLTPFTTSGSLSTNPNFPISSAPTSSAASIASSSHARQAQRPATPPPRTLYRLSSVVCHYGEHSFGHYVCFRRRPRPPSAGRERFAPPTLHEVREGGGRWLRISDDDVREVSLEGVLAEGRGAFMLYYERIVLPAPAPAPAPVPVPEMQELGHARPSVYARIADVPTPRSSEETIRPATPPPLAVVARAPTTVAHSNVATISNREIMNGSMASPVRAGSVPRVVHATAARARTPTSRATSPAPSYVTANGHAENVHPPPRPRPLPEAPRPRAPSSASSRPSSVQSHAPLETSKHRQPPPRKQSLQSRIASPPGSPPPQPVGLRT